MLRMLSVCAVLMPFAVNAEVPRVVADIAPVHSLVARVMQGVGVPDLILPTGASPHDHAMRPSEARAVQRADLVVWIGPGLTPWLAGSLDTLAQGAERLTLMDNPITKVLDARDEALFSEEDDHAHEHGHDHGDTDPHVWLSPQNGVSWLNVIAEHLAQLDPENADNYRRNAKAGADEVLSVSASLKTALGDKDVSDFMVFHDAYHYFEDSFGLRALGAISLSDGQQPSPAHLAGLRDVLQGVDHLCVVMEPQANADLVAAVTQGIAVKVVELDPIDGRIELGPDYYPDLLTKLGQGLAGCLGK